MSGKSTSTMLLFLGRRGPRCWKIGIPNVSYDLPCPVGLLFPNFDVLAVVLDRFTAGVSHRLFVSAAHVGEIAGLRYFNLGRLPTDGSAWSRQHFFPGAPNRFPRLRTRSVRWHHNRGFGVIRDCFVDVLGARSCGPFSVEIAKGLLDLRVRRRSRTGECE